MTRNDVDPARFSANPEIKGGGLINNTALVITGILIIITLVAFSQLVTPMMPATPSVVNSGKYLHKASGSVSVASNIVGTFPTGQDTADYKLGLLHIAHLHRPIGDFTIYQVVSEGRAIRQDEASTALRQAASIWFVSGKENNDGTNGHDAYRDLADLCPALEEQARRVMATLDGSALDTSPISGIYFLRGGTRVRMLGHETQSCEGHTLSFSHIQVADGNSDDDGRSEYLLEGTLHR